MLLVLDSNEYLFALRADPKPSAVRLLKEITASFPDHQIRIPRLVVEEIRRHLPPENFREFLSIIRGMTTIDEDLVVPFELATKYEQAGLKPADAFIAAYSEWVGADALITENRHFLARRTDLPFRVLTAEAFHKRQAH